MSESENNTSRLEAISTRWTLLRQAHGGSAISAEEARNALVLRYLPAVRRYVAALVQNDAAADDLAQDVAVRLLSGDFAGADPGRGRFRDLLKTAIRNMVRNHWAKQKRRHTVAADLALVEGQADETDDRAWLGAWRSSVLDLAWRAMEQEERVRPGTWGYTLLRLRADYPDDSSEELAARLAAKTGQPIRADAVRQRLRRARVRFADLLIAEIGNGLRDPTPERIEAELVALGLLEFVREILPERGGR